MEFKQLSITQLTANHYYNLLFPNQKTIVSSPQILINLMMIIVQDGQEFFGFFFSELQLMDQS